MVIAARWAAPPTRPASRWASTADEPRRRVRVGNLRLLLAARARLRIRVAGEVQHLARVLPRLARHFESTQHARQFLGAFIHGEFGDRGARGLAIREFRDAQVMMALA